MSYEGSNILLIGSDARVDAEGHPLSATELEEVGTEDAGGGVNTDTLIIVHIPPGGVPVTAVSIPRDTWIGPEVVNQVNGPYSDGSAGPYLPNKVNSFYGTAKEYAAEYMRLSGNSGEAVIEQESSEAGRTMLIRVLQAFTGLKIDHFAEVNLLGFYLLSNALGGVPVCLNGPVKDPWSGADFDGGPQELDGRSALAFVRQRHGLPAGDLDRVRRQQAFLKGATNKILSARTLADPVKLHNLITAMSRSVVFDRDLDPTRFAQQIINLAADAVVFKTLPTTGPEKSTDRDALGTERPQVEEFFRTISLRSAKATPFSERQLVNSGPERLASSLVSTVRRASVDVDRRTEPETAEACVD